MSGGEAAWLLGDIGGTNARFCLYRPAARSFHDERLLPTAGYPGPAEAITAYLDGVRGRRPVRGALALASPVLGDAVSLTNQRWRFSVQELRERLGMRTLRVLNDFGAQALAVPRLAAGDCVAVGGGTPRERGAVGVLGPGTGCGVAGLIWSDGAWCALPGEGGHVTLAALDARQEAVIGRLRERFGHVSAERALSGPGLVNLYEALCALDGRAPAALDAPAITARAVAGTCAACVETLDLFYRFLGVVAGNLALTLGASGGIYLAGGILPRLAASLQESPFRRCFVAKGRFERYLEAVPTRLIVRRNPAFLGLAAALESAVETDGP